MKHAAKRAKIVKRLTRTWVTVAGAFLLSLLAFGFVLLLPFVTARLTPDEEPEDVMGGRGVQRAAWLLVHDGDVLTGLIKVITDTRSMAVTAIGYPPQTEVIDGVTVTTAAALYPEQGERVARAIAELPVISLSVGGAAALIGRVSGNLPFTLPQAVGTLEKGELTLTPLQAAAVLCFDDWEEGGVRQAWAHAALTAAFINRALTETRDTKAAFGELTAVCDGALHISQFEAVRDDLQALGVANTGTICTAQVAAGYMTGYAQKQRYVLT